MVVGLFCTPPNAPRLYSTPTSVQQVLLCGQPKYRGLTPLSLSHKVLYFLVARNSIHVVLDYGREGCRVRTLNQLLIENLFLSPIFLPEKGEAPPHPSCQSLTFMCTHKAFICFLTFSSSSVTPPCLEHRRSAYHVTSTKMHFNIG